MPVEIEAKMAVEELEMVRGRLRDNKAEPVAVTMETNIFFDTEDRSLLAADEGLRLRMNHDLSGPGNAPDTYIITFKGARQQGPLKSRDEVELTVADPGDAGQLLQRLGFHRVLTFEKRRETWKLGGCKVELDTVPHLGSYVEVEGPQEQAVMAVRATLGLADRPILKASYVAMLMAYLQERGRSERVVTF